MKRKIRNSFFFIISVIGLQQITHLLGEIFRNEQEIILGRDMDPSVFFYTESGEALRAEKTVRNKLVDLRKD